MRGVIGTNQEIRAHALEFVRGREHQFANALPVTGTHASHVSRERMSMHGDFGMVVSPHERRTFHTDGAVTQRRAFRRNGHDADVLCHGAARLRLRVSLLDQLRDF